MSGVPVKTDSDRFRAKVRQFLLANQSHIAIVKLHQNEPLTKTDLTVHRRLAEDDLKPWRRDMWCIPRVDGTYVARMEDVLDLYAEAPGGLL